MAIEAFILGIMMFITIIVYIKRLKHIKMYWMNFVMEMIVFWLCLHMVEGVTGMYVSLGVNFLFMAFGNKILIWAGFRKKVNSNEK